MKQIPSFTPIRAQFSPITPLPMKPIVASQQTVIAKAPTIVAAQAPIVARQAIIRAAPMRALVNSNFARLDLAAPPDATSAQKAQESFEPGHPES